MYDEAKQILNNSTRIALNAFELYQYIITIRYSITPTGTPT